MGWLSLQPAPLLHAKGELINFVLTRQCGRPPMSSIDRCNRCLELYADKDIYRVSFSASLDDAYILVKVFASNMKQRLMPFMTG